MHHTFITGIFSAAKLQCSAFCYFSFLHFDLNLKRIIWIEANAQIICRRMCTRTKKYSVLKLTCPKAHKNTPP